jgi:hemolysin III
MPPTDASDRSPVNRVKPRLRGVSHQIAFFVALPAGALLVGLAPGPAARLSAAVFAGSLALLLGTSALYHRPMWPPGPREILGRFDHAAIFVLIAGTYTPLCLLAMEPSRGRLLLRLAWGCAAVGGFQVLLYARAPRWLKTAIYVAMGWAGLLAASDLGRSLGPLGLTLMAGGGVLYTVGALIYGLRRPDPLPAVFGYHEIFHLLVIAGATCHFVALARFIVTQAGG